MQIFLLLASGFSVAADHFHSLDKFLFLSVILLAISVPFAVFGALLKLIISFLASRLKKSYRVPEKPKESKKVMK